MERKKKIISQKLDYEKLCEEFIDRKYAALKYWFIKKSKDGSSGVYVVQHLYEKQQSLHDELFGRVVTIDCDSVLVKDSFRERIYDEFEKRKKLNHPKFISDTITMLSDIKRETGSLEKIDGAAPIKIVRRYAYYKAYEIFIEALKKQLKSIGNEVDDNRIKGKLAKEEIEKYFKENFSKKQKDLNPILSEQQIIHFLHANFSDFSPKKEVEKFSTPNTTQKQLRKIINDFHWLHNPTNKTGEYVILLLDNFDKFNNTTFSSEKASFSKK